MWTQWVCEDYSLRSTKSFKDYLAVLRLLIGSAQMLGVLATTLAAYVELSFPSGMLRVTTTVTGCYTHGDDRSESNPLRDEVTR